MIMRQPHPSNEQLDRLNAVSDAIADLLECPPEDVMTEPSRLRISLTLEQAETLLAATNPPLES